MALQFTREEHEQRIARARERLIDGGFDALVIFAQESHYYLTGFDTNGYVFFQCAVLSADEQPITLLTRRPDLEGARRTSILEDIRIWYDAEDANPARDLKAILDEKGLAGGRVGVELATYGLTGANWEMVRRELEGWCHLEDGSDVIRALRLVKSETEIAYHRRAAELADEALDSMIETAGPGVFEGDIAAAGQNAIYRGGGDPPASGPVLGSGDRALLIRNSTGMTSLRAEDQLTMEFAGVYRRYHACIMRTILIGRENPEQRSMFDACKDALAAMTEAVRPGYPVGEIDEAHRLVIDAAGYETARMGACGYSLGATYRPNWMDAPPILYAGNPLVQEPGMVFFTHVILLDAKTNKAMSLGQTVAVTRGGREVLSRKEPTFIVRS